MLLCTGLWATASQAPRSSTAGKCVRTSACRPSVPDTLRGEIRERESPL